MELWSHSVANPRIILAARLRRVAHGASFASASPSPIIPLVIYLSILPVHNVPTTIYTARPAIFLSQEMAFFLPVPFSPSTTSLPSIDKPRTCFSLSLSRRVRRAARFASTNPAVLLKVSSARERVRRHFANLNCICGSTTQHELDLDFDTVVRRAVGSVRGSVRATRASSVVRKPDEQCEEVVKWAPSRRILDPPPSLRSVSFIAFPSIDTETDTDSTSLCDATLRPLSPPPSHHYRRRALSDIGGWNEDEEGDDACDFSSCQRTLPAGPAAPLRFPF
ncbi:hypothetical protein OF83DRAFT_500658 [Amylostereum chailletii]|nr:hypothetical protein OF83DRAFT_500658 [Amylostereum chailletii]